MASASKTNAPRPIAHMLSEYTQVRKTTAGADTVVFGGSSQSFGGLAVANVGESIGARVRRQP